MLLLTFLRPSKWRSKSWRSRGWHSPRSYHPSSRTGESWLQTESEKISRLVGRSKKTWVQAIETGWFRIWGWFFWGMCFFWKQVVLFFKQRHPKDSPKNIGSFYHWIFLYFLFARLDILSCSLWKFSKSEFCTFPKLWASLQTEAWVWAKQLKVAQWSYHAKLAPDGHEVS